MKWFFYVFMMTTAAWLIAYSLSPKTFNSEYTSSENFDYCTEQVHKYEDSCAIAISNSDIKFADYYYGKLSAYIEMQSYFFNNMYPDAQRSETVAK